MERFSFEIERQEVADVLQGVAEANGRSIEAEVAALVERTYVPAERKTPPKDDCNWVQELITMADGLGFDAPEWRGSERIAPSYPAGMDPLPNESFVDHITRISRPGIVFEVERDRTPHAEPKL